MKWSLQQLNKFYNQDYNFDVTYDFTEDIKNIDDIISISEVNVHGIIHVLDYDKFEFDLHIKCTMTLEDAITLDPVEFNLDLEVIEIFSVEDNGDDDIILIDTNTVELRPVIWENIIINKPIRFVSNESPDELK